MTEEQIKKATLNKLKIIYVKKGTEYQLLGFGKGKLNNGNWFEGVTYIGEDGVFYLRPYNMFKGFKIK